MKAPGRRTSASCWINRKSCWVTDVPHQTQAWVVNIFGAFWRRKLSDNRARDRLVTRTLRRAGWRVLRIWEHELAKIKTRSTPHPGLLPGRGGEGEARLVKRLRSLMAV